MNAFPSRSIIHVQPQFRHIMFQPNLFSGKTALVTGGGSGIGRKPERLEKALTELSHWGRVYARATDIREPEQVAALADFIAEKCGKLDILVNNAGGQFAGPAEDISPKGWQAVINTNLNGTWFVTQIMAKRFFFPKNEGAIVNIVVNNYRGTPGMAHSAAARAGVSNLTQTLAVEWANKGIRLNSIAPGIIQSSGLENYPPELTEGIARIVPMKRLGTVEEVAWLTLFLVSPMSAYMTGDTIYIDGGARLWGDIWQIE
jgi:citronellol/citronellal dehydrogenase